MGETGMGHLGSSGGLGAGWMDTIKGMLPDFGKAGTDILRAKWGTVPVYTTTQGPYGSSTAVYQTLGQGQGPTGTPGGMQPTGGGAAITTPVGSMLASSDMLLIGGGLVLVLLLSKGGSK